MKEVVLQFPDTEALADFLSKYKLSKIEINSRYRCIKGYVTDLHISLAEIYFAATIITSIDNFQNVLPR